MAGMNRRNYYSRQNLFQPSYGHLWLDVGLRNVSSKDVFPLSFNSLSLSLCPGDGNSKISSVYINNTHGVDDDDFYDRNLALFEVWNSTLTETVIMRIRALNVL